jgi:hypothetical protein
MFVDSEVGHSSDARSLVDSRVRQESILLAPGCKVLRAKILCSGARSLFSVDHPFLSKSGILLPGPSYSGGFQSFRSSPVRILVNMMI